MKAEVIDFLREAADRAVSPVGLFQCTTTKLRVTDEDTKRSLWIITSYVGGRHGCGWEQDGFWSRCNDADVSVGAQGYTFEVVRVSSGHLIEPICEGLAKHFPDAERVSVRVDFTPYPNSPEQKSLIGDTDGGVLFEMPEPPESA